MTTGSGIDMASVYAVKYRKTPDILRAAVMGQSPDKGLDSYTALNALKLVKEADMTAMAGQAQQPTSAPSFVAQALAPPAPPQGLAGMIPMGAPVGQMPQGMPQGMPQRAPQAPMPQQTMQAASGGLAGMYTPEEDYADGGIVAFAEPTPENNYSLVRDETAPEYVYDPNGASSMRVLESEAVGDDGEANPTTLTTAQAMLAKYMGFEPKEMSVADQEAFLDRYEKRMEKAAGPNIYAPAKERQKAREDAIAGDRRSGEGMALLTAAGKILKGRNLAEGASEALPAYAQQLAEVRKAEREEKRSIEQMNFSLADAERKERMGNTRGAQAALEAARKFQQDANKAQSDKLRYGADIAARTVNYSRMANKGAGDKAPKVPEQLAKAEYDNLMAVSKPNPGESETAFEARIRAQALRATQVQLAQKQTFSMSDIPKGGAKDTNAQAIITSRENTAAQGALNDFKTYKKTAWKKYVADNGGDEKAAETAYKSGWMTKNPNAGADDFDPNKAVDYIPTAKPAATSSVKPGAVLNYDANGKRID
jgi:hypothetical protein